MWWKIILAVVVWILFSFIRDLNKQKNNIKQQGGMKLKYRVLIDNILSKSPQNMEVKETSDSILIGASSAMGSVLFMIVQTFSVVTVQYKSKNPMIGNVKLEWEFNPNMDQNLMFEKIDSDLKEHYMKTISKNI